MMLDQLLAYAGAHRDEIAAAVRAHVALSGSALAIACVASVPLGIWCAHNKTVASGAIAAVNAARVVPSLAVLTLMLPLLGLGFAPALVALALLACPPIL